MFNILLSHNLSAFPDSSTTSKVPEWEVFFSMDQWRELELQALIFKYMLAGVAVPPKLLSLFNRSLLSGTASCPHHPYHRSQHYQPAILKPGYWGRSGVDPEPGRCRRTDRKKWRCSRDVATGHKYCERHMHRGRNRSRKPVEIPIPTAHGGGGQRPTPFAASTLTAVANGNHFALSVSSPSIDLLHLDQRDIILLSVKQELGSLVLRSVLQGGKGRQVGRGVLQHFFDDWPSLDNHHQHQEQQQHSLSISTFGNGIAPSSDFSLKLSTGNEDDDVAGESLQRRQQVVRSNNNWSMGWRGYPAASMEGPLAEALRSSTSNSSPSCVLHELPHSSSSKASSMST